MSLRNSPCYRLLIALTMMLAGLLCASTASASDSPYPIAGINPDRRPAAPVITEVIKTNEWYEHAVTGVQPPYPNSLRFLESQGNWYTPFNRPGMPGRYDIRHWYQMK